MTKYSAELVERCRRNEPLEETRKWYLKCLMSESYDLFNTQPVFFRYLTQFEQRFVRAIGDDFKRLIKLLDCLPY